MTTTQSPFVRLFITSYNQTRLFVFFFKVRQAQGIDILIVFAFPTLSFLWERVQSSACPVVAST